MAADTSAANMWTFWFSDGSAFSIEGDYLGHVFWGMAVCDACVGERPDVGFIGESSEEFTGEDAQE